MSFPAGRSPTDDGDVKKWIGDTLVAAAASLMVARDTRGGRQADLVDAARRDLDEVSEALSACCPGG